jgi:hypothetical protein
MVQRGRKSCPTALERLSLPAAAPDPNRTKSTATLQKKIEVTPEDVARGLEKATNTLLEESAFANANGNLRVALEKARDAVKKERQLTKHRDANGLQEQQNVELTYATSLNLALQCGDSRFCFADVAAGCKRTTS